MYDRIGTLDELKGEGIEALLDRPTRTVIIAVFIDGFFFRGEAPRYSGNNDETVTLERVV